jgi:hypothetical protein
MAATIDVENEPERIPVDRRIHLLRLALDAVQRGLDESGIEGLDYFGRLGLLELALDDAHQHMTAQLPPERTN